MYWKIKSTYIISKIWRSKTNSFNIKFDKINTNMSWGWMRFSIFLLARWKTPVFGGSDSLIFRSEEVISGLNFCDHCGSAY